VEPEEVYGLSAAKDGRSQAYRDVFMACP